MPKQPDVFFPADDHLPEMLRRVRNFNPDADLAGMARSFQCAKQSLTVARLMENHFQRYGLSQGRFTVLLMLFLFPEKEWTGRVLAEVAQVSRPTVSGLLRGLEEDEAIRRAPHPRDGRSQTIKLTRKGTRRMKKILPDHHRRLKEAFGDLEQQRQADFTETFTEMIERFSRI